MPFDFGAEDATYADARYGDKPLAVNNGTSDVGTSDVEPFTQTRSMTPDVSGSSVSWSRTRTWSFDMSSPQQPQQPSSVWDRATVGRLKAR